ncbi:MAG: efflux RND transporter permease subunit, partial [Oscillospiraceae bacterium]
KYSLNSAQKQLDGGASTAQDKLANAGAEITNAIANVNGLLAEETTLSSQKKAFEMEKTGTDAAGKAMQGLKTIIDNAFGGAGNILTVTDDAVFKANWATVISSAQSSGIPLNDQLLNMTLAGSKVFYPTIQPQIDKFASRTAEIDVELRNIDTRMAVITAMKPSLQSGLEQAKNGFAQIQSGQMTATSELAKAQAQIISGKSQIDEGITEFEKSRDDALEQADLSNIITEKMISGILTAQNFSMPAGYLEDNGEKFLVKVGDVYKSMEELENTLLFSLKSTGDIRIKDVATVSLQNSSDGSYAKINGSDGIVLSFQKQSTASTADVSDKIADTIETLCAKEPELRITPLMDQGDYIDIIVGSVLENLAFGGLLAILVLILFLRDFKPTFIIACSIPISLMFAVTLMYFSNVTLNIISLSGLALGVGMLVDNSIVVIENIYRMRNSGTPPKKAAVEGAKQVSGAIFASTLTTVCVFLPIVFTEGMTRQLFADMGLTIAYSLFASLLVALTLVPAMSSLMLRHTAEKKDGLFVRFVNRYEAVLRWALNHRAAVLGSAAALLIIAVFGVTVMGTAFMPEMNSEQMSATLSVSKNDKGVDIAKLADEVSDRILEIDDVEYVGALSGGMGSSMGGGSSDSMSFYILLKEDRVLSNKDVERMIYDNTKDLSGELSVQSSTMDMSMLSGSGISILLKSNNMDDLMLASNQIAGILGKVEGLSEITTGYEEADTELRITVNKDAAMKYNLTVAQIYSDIASALSKETDSTTLSSGDSNYPVVIVNHKTSKITPDNLNSFKFKGTNQEKEEVEISLSEIADVSQVKSVNAVKRENQSRYNSVTAAIADGYNIGIVSRDVDKALEGYIPPVGCTIETEGENVTINQALGDLVQMVLLAIVFIYLIMVAQFQSLLSPFIVLFTIPLAFTGGLLLLWVCGMELSVIAMLGFLVLAGVVVNNGIVFVDYANQLRLEGMNKREALIETGRTRIRPILMTALTTILAMSTMALGIGSGAEMTQPMAVVTIGGLTYATALTLIVVPVMYDMLHRRPMKPVDVEEE